MVGVLLPATVAGSLVNIAILLAGKVPVNLNFTAGAESMAAAVSQCQITTIITSRHFYPKQISLSMPGMVFVEDIRKTFTGAQKFMIAAKAFLLPARWLNRRYRKQQRSSDLATVIFSSGSTGVPKGVMLSHHNILANVESIAQVIQLMP